MAKRKKITWEVNEKGCHICTSHAKDKDGYICYRNKHNQKSSKLHRYLYEEKFGEIPKGMVLRHSCNEPSCINLDHLKIGTQQDNINDKVNANRQANGEKHGMNKFTQKIIMSIMQDTRKYEDIANTYDLSVTHVVEIKNSKQWKHIKCKILKGDNQVRGEKQYNAKLDESKVREIRKDKRPTVKVAKDYGVSRKLIDNIRKNRTWKHIVYEA